jgi:DNA-binding transcriptional regulator/RsmH inhibitor MraZ
MLRSGIHPGYSFALDKDAFHGAHHSSFVCWLAKVKSSLGADIRALFIRGIPATTRQQDSNHDVGSCRQLQRRSNMKSKNNGGLKHRKNKSQLTKPQRSTLPVMGTDSRKLWMELTGKLLFKGIIRGTIEKGTAMRVPIPVEFRDPGAGYGVLFDQVRITYFRPGTLAVIAEPLFDVYLDRVKAGLGNTISQRSFNLMYIAPAISEKLDSHNRVNLQSHLYKLLGMKGDSRSVVFIANEAVILIMSEANNDAEQKVAEAEIVRAMQTTNPLLPAPLSDGETNKL